VKISALLLTGAVLGSVNVSVLARTPPVAFPSQRAFTSLSYNRVAIFDTSGSEDPRRWVEVTRPGTFRAENLVLQNGRVRIRYLAGTRVTEQRGSHAWFVKNGDSYLEVTSPYYGDYSYFVNTITQPPAMAEVRELSPTKATVDYLFASHEIPDPPVWAGARPGALPFVKRFTILDDMPGAFVKYISSPANPSGERELGMGMMNETSIGATPLELWDADSGDESKPMSDASYVLGFPREGSFTPSHAERKYYVIMANVRGSSPYMYNLGIEAFGGPIVRFAKQQSEIGVFMGVVPYSNDVVFNAEHLTLSDALPLPDPAARNGTAVSMAYMSRLDMVVPRTFATGSYDISVRYKATLYSRLSVSDGFNSFVTYLDATDSYVTRRVASGITLAANLPLTLTLHFGSADVDCIYIIPRTGKDESFPGTVNEEVVRSLKSTPDLDDGH
jgi:hypothetical protein